MKIFTLISAMLFFQSTNAQQTYNQAIRQFTDVVFNKAHRLKTKLNVAESDYIDYKEIYSLLEKRIFIKRIQYPDKVVIDTFEITVVELQYIDSFLQTANNFRWNDSLIDKALIIPKDTVDWIYNNHKNNVDYYLAKRYGHRRIFFLAKPIFLRDYTICIFYESSDCGMWCGGGSLTIYRKKEGEWESFRILQEWVE